MMLFLQNYRIRGKPALAKAGYKWRDKDKDWIREDGIQGRWHAKSVLKGLVYAIHYDLYVDGKHKVFDMPIHAKVERRRIYRKLSYHKSREMTDREFQGLLEK